MSRPFPPSSPPSVDRGEIARLNDLLRDQITAPGRNRVLMTRGIAELLGDVAIFRNFRKRAELLRAVRAHDTFSPANDPYGEHDLGMFVFEGISCMWKIDYYDPSLSVGSEDPANSSVTIRVLTIMRADER